jgi:hypothetical protein
MPETATEKRKTNGTPEPCPECPHSIDDHEPDPEEEEVLVCQYCDCRIEPDDEEDDEEEDDDDDDDEDDDADFDDPDDEDGGRRRRVTHAAPTKSSRATDGVRGPFAGRRGQDRRGLPQHSDRGRSGGVPVRRL